MVYEGALFLVLTTYSMAQADFFASLIQRVAPKHWVQASGEVRVVTKWLETFSGDTVRQLARSFAVPGDHVGQETRGYRW